MMFFRDFLSRGTLTMIKRYLKQNKNLWLGAIFFVLLIKLFSSNENWVETAYATKFYSFFSQNTSVHFRMDSF